MLSVDYFGALDAPLANEVAGKVVNVQPVALSCYPDEEVWSSVEKVVDPTLTLRDARSSHVKSTASSMSVRKFDFRIGMIALTWSSKCNPTDTSMEDSVAEADDLKVMRKKIKDDIIWMGVTAVALCTG